MRVLVAPWQKIVAEIEAAHAADTRNQLYLAKLKALKLQCSNIRGGPNSGTTSMWTRVKADVAGIVRSAGKDMSFLPLPSCYYYYDDCYHDY